MIKTSVICVRVIPHGKVATVLLAQMGQPHFSVILPREEADTFEVNHSYLLALAEEGAGTAESAPEMDHEVTPEDLKANPDLVDAGVKAGDTIGVPVAESTEPPKAAAKKAAKDTNPPASA